MISTVYIHIRHSLFWYGHYGFCENSCNDEITVYRDKDKKEFLGYFEVITHCSLEYLINNEEDLEVDYPEFYKEIEEFLNSDNKVYYSYIYPRDKEDIDYQVRHSAPVNDKGHKPVYIYMWSKLSDYWNEDEIKKCVKILSKEFFNEEILNVEILDIPTYEKTEVSYNEDYVPLLKSE